MRLSTTTLARGSARRPWLTLGIWVLALLGAGAIIAFVLPGSLTAQYSFLGQPDSKTGQELLAQKLDMPQKANEVVIVRSQSATVSDPAFRAAVVALQTKLTALGPERRRRRRQLLPRWRQGTGLCRRPQHHPPDRDGRRPRSGREEHRHGARGRARRRRQSRRSTHSSPARPASRAISVRTAERDLTQGEAIGVPIALIILLIVFGAVVAAGLPIVLSLIAITVAVALTALVGQTFDVSVFAINMISMMGLATGIDYSLFIISRYREERALGREQDRRHHGDGRHGQPRRAVQRAHGGARPLRPPHRPDQHLRQPRHRRDPGGQHVRGRGADPAARRSQPAGRPREQSQGAVSWPAAAVGEVRRTHVGVGAPCAALDAASGPRPLDRRRRAVAGRRAGHLHEDRRVRREQLPRRLREQGGVRRARPPVLRRRRQPAC